MITELLLNIFIQCLSCLVWFALGIFYLKLKKTISTPSLLILAAIYLVQFFLF